MPKECWNCEGMMEEKEDVRGKYFECSKCKATETILVKPGESALMAPVKTFGEAIGGQTPRPIKRKESKKEKKNA